MFFRIFIYLIVLFVSYIGSMIGMLYVLIKIDKGVPQGPHILIIPVLIAGLISLFIDNYLFK